MTAAQKLFGFQGRLRRRDWWLFTAALGVIYVMMMAMLMAGMGSSIMPNTFHGRVPFSLSDWWFKRSLAQLIAVMVLLWPLMATGIKRLHDRGRPGWWAALFWGLVLVSQGLFMAHMKTGAGIFGLLSILNLAAVALIGLWLWIELGLLDGTAGPNRFGPSPKLP